MPNPAPAIARPPRRLRLYHRLYSRTYTFTRWYARHVSPAGTLALAGFTMAASIGLDTNLAMAYQAFTLLLAIILTAFLTRRLLRPPALSVERHIPRLAAVGVPLSYTITLHNRAPRLQKDLRIQESPADPRPTLETFSTSPEPGESKRNPFDRSLLYYRWRWLIRNAEHAQMRAHPVPAMAARSSVTVKMELHPMHRGVLHLDGLTLTVPEPLGLLRRSLALTQPANLIILPKRYAVPPLALPGSRRYQPGGIALAGQVGDSEEFMSMRDYRPGDTLRHIHHRSWARTGKPVVKEFEDEFFVRHALILDTFCAPEKTDIFEAAVSVASSFACTIDTQESLLDLLFVGTEAYCFTAGRGLGYSEQLLTVLASVHACHSRPFADLTHLVVRRARLVSGVVCVFVTWDEARQHLVSQLQTLGVPVLVCVITEPGSPRLAPGVLAATPQAFHPLETDQLAAGLTRLGQQNAMAP